MTVHKGVDALVYDIGAVVVDVDIDKVEIQLVVVMSLISEKKNPPDHTCIFHDR